MAHETKIIKEFCDTLLVSRGLLLTREAQFFAHSPHLPFWLTILFATSENVTVKAMLIKKIKSDRYSWRELVDAVQA